MRRTTPTRFRPARLFPIFLLLHATASGNIPTGSIGGTVNDSCSGKPLINVDIVVLGTFFGTASDSAGRFLIGGIPPGAYDVEASLLGHEPRLLRGIEVTAGRNAILSIPLKQTVLELAEIKVLSTPITPLPNPDQLISVHELPQDELRTLARGLDDPLRALSLTPGVSQPKMDRNDLCVRGGNPGENLIVIDGIEIPSISHFGMTSSTSGSSSVIDLELIKSTSLSAGGFGVRYGDKLSSVVNLRLRDPEDGYGSVSPNLSTTQIGVSGESSLPGNGGVLFSVRRSYLDVIFRAYRFGFIPQFWDGLLKADYRLGTSDKLTLLAVGAADFFSILNNSEENLYKNSRLLFTDQNSITSALTWQHAFNSGVATVSGTFTRRDARYSQDSPDLTPWFAASVLDREVELQGNMIITMGKHWEFEGGLSLRNKDFIGSIFSVNAPSMYAESYLKVSSRLNAVITTAAGYLQLSHISGPLTMSVGLREDFDDATTHPPVFSPRLSTRLALTPGFDLHWSVGRYYQSPDPLWLTATSYNRQLSPMRADQMILGGEIGLSNCLLVSLEAYQKNYVDYPASINRPYLVMANTGSGLGGSVEGYASFGIDSLQSRGSGRSRGIEFYLQKKTLESRWHSALSATHSLTYFVGTDGIRRPASYGQPWVVFLEGGYILPHDWELGGKFFYYSGRPYTPFNRPIAIAYNEATIAANHRLDIYVSRIWTFSQWTLTTYLNIMNVYDRKAIDVPIMSEIDRRVEQPPALGIVPTLGVRANF